MKRVFMYLLIAAAFASAASCKKQIVEETEIIITDSTPVNNPPPADPLPATKGLLVGKIMPETKVALTLYNENFSFTDFSIINRSGAFMMKDLQPGDYTLRIEPYDPNLSPLELTRITIDSGRTTNLGLITMP